MGLQDAHAALSGKVAIVVGGAAGFLGRGVTLGLAQAGVSIICCDNDSEGLAAIAPDVEALGAKITAIEADVADENSLDRFYDQVEANRDLIDHALRRLARVHPAAAPWVTERLAEFGLTPPLKGGTTLDFLRRPEVRLQALAAIDPELAALPPLVAEQVEIEAKYAGYLAKQSAEVDRFRRLEERPIPAGFDYGALVGLSAEVRQKLEALRPATLAQAARMEGVTPAALMLLLAHVRRAPERRTA